MEEMSDRELLQKNIEEFSRMQRYMLLAEKDSEVYRAIKVRYVGIKGHFGSVRCKFDRTGCHKGMSWCLNGYQIIEI